VVAVLLLLFWLGTRRMKVIPGRGQGVLEFAYTFVRDQIVYGALGEKDGKRYMPLLVSMFFFIVGMNITGIIPGLNLGGSARAGLPIVLAMGIKKHPGSFFKNSLFPPNVPWYLYLLVTPIEFLSTFILRPITLFIRLLMNLVAGHILLVLCFSATQFFFFSAGGFYSLFGVGTLAFGFVFTLFELLVAILQAYVFTYLTAVYIQLALAEEH
jgi:F-type H+-transporting ATPase subunit a